VYLKQGETATVQTLPDLTIPLCKFGLLQIFLSNNVEWTDI